MQEGLRLMPKRKLAGVKSRTKDNAPCSILLSLSLEVSIVTVSSTGTRHGKHTQLSHYVIMLDLQEPISNRLRSYLLLIKNVYTKHIMPYFHIVF